MQALSQEHYEKMMREDSPILTRKHLDGAPPMSSRFFVSIEDIKGYYKDLIEDEIDGRTGHRILSHLSLAQEELREALEEWERFNEAQDGKYNEPVDRFLDSINRARAKLKILQEERAEVERVIAEHEKKREREERRRKESFDRRQQKRLKKIAAA